jgi:hypothetical protein
METFKIEIQELLARVIEIEAETMGDAISKIYERYKKAEIVLDYNDFVEVNFLDIHSQSKEDEKKKLVIELTDYLFETEPENHIYKKLIRLKELNLD